MFTISALLLGSESVTGEDEATSGVRVMSWAGQLNNETKPTRKDSFHSVTLFSCCYLTRAVREAERSLQSFWSSSQGISWFKMCSSYIFPLPTHNTSGNVIKIQIEDILRSAPTFMSFKSMLTSFLFATILASFCIFNLNVLFLDIFLLVFKVF